MRFKMRDCKLFGKYVVEVAEAAREVILEEEVGKFLGRPNEILGNVSPLELIWKDGEKGLTKVKKTH